MQYYRLYISFTCLHTYMYIYTYIYIIIHICVCIYTWCIYIYMYVSISGAPSDTYDIMQKMSGSERNLSVVKYEYICSIILYMLIWMVNTKHRHSNLRSLESSILTKCEEILFWMETKYTKQQQFALPIPFDFAIYSFSPKQSWERDLYSLVLKHGQWKIPLIVFFSARRIRHVW